MRALLLAALFVCGAVSTSAADVESIPIPRRSKRLAENHHQSGTTFRKTVTFFRKQLARRGVPHREVPVYRYRGVLIARFLAEGDQDWNAVHVFKLSGKTYVYVVPQERKKGVDPGVPSE